MTKRILLALGAVALTGCGAEMSADEVDRLENGIRAAAESRGLTVRAIDLRAESNDVAVGNATVALLDDPAREATWSCNAQRLEGTRMRWRCAPPAGQAVAAPGSAPQPVTQDDGRARLAGRWTDTGDCNLVTLLREDGTFVAPNGAYGNWDVEGSQLTFSGPNGSVTLTVTLDDPNVMTVTTADGTVSRSTRC